MLIYKVYEIEGTTSKKLSIKMLTLKKLPLIGIFMYDVYLPDLDNIFILYTILVFFSKPKYICGSLRKDTYYSKAKNISTIRHCTERIPVNVNLDIQSSNFGSGRSISSERCNVEIVDANLSTILKFYFHFSNNNRQYTYCTCSHDNYAIKIKSIARHI